MSLSDKTQFLFINSYLLPIKNKGPVQKNFPKNPKTTIAKKVRNDFLKLTGASLKSPTFVLNYVLQIIGRVLSIGKILLRLAKLFISIFSFL